MAATLCVFRAEYEKEEEEEQEERDGEATYNRNKNQELFVNKIKKKNHKDETKHRSSFPAKWLCQLSHIIL